MKLGGSDATPQTEIYMGLRVNLYSIFVKLLRVFHEKAVWRITEMHYNGLWGVIRGIAGSSESKDSPKNIVPLLIHMPCRRRARTHIKTLDP